MFSDFIPDLRPLYSAINNIPNVQVVDIAVAYMLANNFSQSPTTPIDIKNLVSDLINEDQITDTINKLGHEWFDITLSDDFSSTLISSVFIRKEYNQHTKRKDEILRQSNLSRSSESKSLLERVNDSNQQNKEYNPVGYASRTDLEETEFTNWLPVAGFQENKRVYRFNPEFINELANEFPTVDVQFEINKIYKYLRGQPKSIPKSGSILKYIRQIIGKSTDVTVSSRTYLFGPEYCKTHQITRDTQ